MATLMSMDIAAPVCLMFNHTNLFLCLTDFTVHCSVISGTPYRKQH